MYSKTEKRFYDRFYPDGKKAISSVEYTLWFDDTTNKLVDVRNENHEAVERESEVWSFFDGKYNNL